jgi:hypothetical protein
MAVNFNMIQKQNQHPTTNIHDRTRSRPDTYTLINSGGVKLVVLAQSSSVCETMPPTKCPRVS